MKTITNLISQSIHPCAIIFFAILLLACVTSCDYESSPPPREATAGDSGPVAAAPPPAPIVEPPPVTLEPPIADPEPAGVGGEISKPSPTSSENPRPASKPLTEKGVAGEHVIKKSNLENYSVQVSADKQLFIPAPAGEMKVWIGIAKNAPAPDEGMNTITESLNAVGETAKITPFTKGIDVEVVPNESVCIKIDPTGSEVRFKLIPKHAGTFVVSADINLYDSNDCSGAPVPKTAKKISVEVRVNKNTVVTNALSELGTTAWKAFLDFWDKLLIIFFSLLLFLLRKKLFKWFRFKAKE